MLTTAEERMSGDFFLALELKGCIRLECPVRFASLLDGRRHQLPRGNQVFWAEWLSCRAATTVPGLR